MKKEFLLGTLVFVSLLGAVYEGVLYWHSVEPADNLVWLWQVFFVVLLVLWVDADSKGYPKIYRPYEYGYLVFIFWLPYLPFYLWRTRRAIGVAMFGGFLGLYFLGYFGKLLIHAAR
jgi:hypothetical protein